MSAPLFKTTVFLGLEVQDAGRDDGPHLDVSVREGRTEVGITLDRDEVTELRAVLSDWLDGNP